MFRNFKGCFTLFLILIFIILIAAFLWHKAGYAPSIKYNDDKTYALIIDRNDNLDSVLSNIEKTGVHKNITFLRLWMLLKGYDMPKKIGYYKLTKGMSNNELVNTLIFGNQTPVKVTFNNSRDLKHFCRKISKKLILDSIELYNYIVQDPFLKETGFNKENILGMFIPNTYEFYYTVSLKKFCNKMKTEYNRFWNENRKSKLKNLKFSRQEVSILAAIVDGETNMNDEKARIAGVYLNRLRRGMLLQADPTLKFIANDPSRKRILHEDMRIEHPYNTYKYKGLPPGLIRQPSIQGIDAVLNAEKHRYLFFCAKDDFSGYHVFAKTYRQHKINSRKFHKAMNEKEIYR